MRAGIETGSQGMALFAGSYPGCVAGSALARQICALSLSTRAWLDTFGFANQLPHQSKNEPENHGVGGSIPPLHRYLGSIHLQG